MRRFCRTVLILAPYIAWSAFGEEAIAQVLPDKTVRVNGINIHYLEQGAGVPVVFVHGGLADGRIWELQREAFAKNYQFISYTRRYHGAEPWLDDGKQFSQQLDTDDLVAFVKALNRGPVHLVTWSAGGLRGVRAAVAHPELFRSMVHYEPGPLTPVNEEIRLAQRDRDNERAEARKMAEADPVEGMKRLVEATIRGPRESFERLPSAVQASVLGSARTLTLLEANPNPVTCEMAGKLRLSTLIITGDKSDRYYPLVADAMAACIPNSKRSILKDATHGGPAQQADAFNREVLGFLASVRRRP
jgi:pimeloyl-ACP methyl ester carboxylesterase